MAGMILSVLFVSVAVGRHGFYDESAWAVGWL